MTHDILESQILSLVEAWKLNEQDKSLHLLPLHHVHGLVNVLLCSLYTGATIKFLDFEPVQVWNNRRNRDTNALPDL